MRAMVIGVVAVLAGAMGVASASGTLAMRATHAQSVEPVADTVLRLVRVVGQRRELAADARKLKLLYEPRAGRPVWTLNRQPTPQARLAIASLAGAEERGLRPIDYDAPALVQRLAAITRSGALPGDDELARFDVLLSSAVIRFVGHVHHGRIDPRALGFSLDVGRDAFDPVAVTLALSRAANVRAAIDAIEPTFPRFAGLEAALARYRALAADTTLRQLPMPRASVRPGDAYDDIGALARLLLALGDIAPDSTCTMPAVPDRYEGALVAGIESFQRRHGLSVDGVIGRATMAQLRLPLAQRVRQIELTIERWRWLPSHLSRRFVVVNIPAFRLYLFDLDSSTTDPAARMDVIVGRSSGGRRRTPVFVGTMRSVIFRPYWDVPPSIARNEVIPAIRRNPRYATTEGLELVPVHGPLVAVPATEANLQRVLAGTLRIRQRPGPLNPLGSIKFMLPNTFNVYLHGTPAIELFSRPTRDFSHGCIRVREPVTLAEFVMQDLAGWDRARIETAMAEDRTFEVPLAAALPVYVLYSTVVPNEDATPNFYADLYGHDAALSRALASRPVTSLAAVLAPSR